MDTYSLVGLPILNFTHINKDLQNLEGFYGFAPRWTLICKLRNTTNPALNTSAILLVIDSKKEIEIGIGKSFPQVVIGQHEAIVRNTALSYLDINPDNKEPVEIYIDLQ